VRVQRFLQYLMKQECRSTAALTCAGLVCVYLLLSAGPAQPSRRLSSPPFGLIGDSTSSFVVRMNPQTLRPLSGQRLEFAGSATAWAYSPDRAMLAVALEAGTTQGCVDPQASVGFADLTTFTVASDVSLGAGSVNALVWLAPDRALAVVTHCGTLPDLVVLDTATRRVLVRAPLPGEPVRIKTGGSSLVILSETTDRLAPALLTMIDSGGITRSVGLDRIDAGLDQPTASSSGRSISPGLAVTPDGERAFVVSPSGLIAEIELRSLAVSYHALSSSRAVQARSLGRAAKVSTDTSIRIAQVLPTGMLAVAGSEDRSYVDSSGVEHYQHIRTGLAFINTGDWSGLTVDRSADRFVRAGNSVLATGSALGHEFVIEPGVQLPPARGLTAFNLYGLRRFHLFGVNEVAVDESYGWRTFVSAFPPWRRPSNVLRVVDLRTGKIVGKRLATTLPWIIQGSSSTG
jgi:hypothetical protein